MHARRTDRLQMNCLISNGIVEPYGQVTDVKGSYSAQFEHVGEPSPGYGSGQNTDILIDHLAAGNVQRGFEPW